MRLERKRMMALLVTGFYIAGLLCAAHAALNTRTSQGAIAWTVSLVSFPFVAVPAYLVFGRDKFSGMLEALDENRGELGEVYETFDRELDRWRIQPTAAPSWYRAVNRLSGFAITHGNQVELLVDGAATFDSILADVAQAEHYILFQFYMIHDDGLGRRVKAALIERAQAGVAVHVLYDEVGSKHLPAAYSEELRQAGVLVSSFRPNQGFWNHFQLNFRNHRKMVVVDGKFGWVGGHNVGDEYLGLDPDFSPWRDTHVRIEGPAVMQLQMASLADWYWAVRELPALEWIPQASDAGDQQVMILPTAPTGHLETASLAFVSALSSAERRIWISAPYFVPDEAVMKALQLAALRGVDVRIITTGKGDSLPVYLAGFHYIHELRGLDIRFYAYAPGFLHQKALLVDEHIAVVGTHNFDNRSFRLNFEVAAIVVDEAFTAETAAMFEQDFAHSRPIDPDDWEQRSLLWRLGVQLSRLAAPVL
jgi:cardiolipin synthase